jgi:mono/diheme cytochrome c family protein
MVLAVAVSLASTVCFAQSPAEANYKTKCQACHGVNGTPSVGMARAMGIKPNSDPTVKTLTAEQMFTAVKNGKGKMKPVQGLTDAQIKEVVEYYRNLK